jgi:hypothetical protein
VAWRLSVIQKEVWPLPLDSGRWSLGLRGIFVCLGALATGQYKNAIYDGGFRPRVIISYFPATWTTDISPTSRQGWAPKTSHMSNMLWNLSKNQDTLVGSTLCVLSHFSVTRGEELTPCSTPHGEDNWNRYVWTPLGLHLMCMCISLWLILICIFHLPQLRVQLSGSSVSPSSKSLTLNSSWLWESLKLALGIRSEGVCSDNTVPL